MKRIIAATLSFLLLLCMTTAYGAAPGTAADPLVSLNYVNNTFLPSLQSESSALARGAVTELYTEAGDKLKAAYNGYLAQLGGLTDYAFAPTFTPLYLPSGTTAGLVTGSTFMLTSGSADLLIQSGAVINISTGSEVSSGTLAPNQRYFCAENTTAIVTATSDAAGQVDGYYTTTGSVITSPIPFLDVRDADWFFDAVSYVTNRNLFTGISQTAFSPQSSMTRGMFVTVLYRLAGKPAVFSASVFPDVGDASAYYYSAVVWAHQNGIVTGDTDGRFYPDKSITREQMAGIISRYAVYAGYSIAPANTSVFDAFPDNGSVSPYAAEALKWATGAGLINGSDGKIVPKGTATRAQVAQIILKFCRNIIGM
jgi:hypothetical protein